MEGEKKAREERIREIGGILHSRAQPPPLFDARRWPGRLISWAMNDAAFRTSLFRFIDVLPALVSDRAVVTVLQEYFSGLDDAPLLIRQGMRRIPRVFPSLAARFTRSVVESVARQFIAGRNGADALPTLTMLWQQGAASSVDLLGEAVLSESEAAAYAGRYTGLLDVLEAGVSSWPADPLLDADDRGELPRLSISFKISSFDPWLDPADWDGSITRVTDALRPVMARAVDTGASVCFDMEHYHIKDLTMAVFRAVLEEFPSYDHAGIAIQAYLRDSEEDLRSLMGWAEQRKRHVAIRLVKGAYWDYETTVNRQRGWPVPVFLHKAETDRNFEALTGILLGRSSFAHPAIATHNVRGISHAIALAEERGLPRDSFEIQMLHGMAHPFAGTLRDLGCRVRVYTPVGELIPGMAYLVRRLLENTANESIFRQTFGERTSLDHLIRQPEPAAKASPRAPSVEGFVNEPAIDFSLTEHRQHMAGALRAVRESFGRKYPLIVDGGELFTTAEIRSFNPASPQQTVGYVSSASAGEAGQAITAARAAWDTWRLTRPDRRADILSTVAAAMRRDRFELMALEVYEVGKTWTEADGDVSEAIDYLEYYGRQMRGLGRPRPLGDYPGEENDYGYAPLGVGAVISPWNFPLAIATGMIAAALVAGNCVIFKPSGLSPVTGYNIVRYFRGAGLPPGVLQFAPGPGSEVGDYMVSHPDIDFIAFTGSRDVGLGIIRKASDTRPGQRTIKRVIAEMGGKNAIIVDDTADLDEAVRGVLESSLGYQGQKCSACSRVIVTPGVYRAFCSRLKDSMQGVRIGAPEHPGNFMGPVIDHAALEKILRYMAMARREGTILLAGRIDDNSLFVGPTIVTDVDPSSPIAQDEIFGPVIAILAAAGIDEALRIANGVPYALTGGIYSRSPRNIASAREGMNVGNLYVNRKITGALVGRQPFGGHGMSGLGSKAGGPDYLLHFLNPRSISENTLRRGFAPPRRRAKD